MFITESELKYRWDSRVAKEPVGEEGAKAVMMAKEHLKYFAQSLGGSIINGQHYVKYDDVIKIIDSMSINDRQDKKEGERT